MFLALASNSLLMSQNEQSNVLVDVDGRACVADYGLH